MGRLSKPQKSKKNKKMKAIDPFYVGDRISDRYAEKYNRTPKVANEQEFSRGAKEILKLKTRTKKRLKNQKKDNSFIDMNENLGLIERGVCRPMTSVPEFRKRKRETEETFLHRVDRETQAVISKSQFEDKYQIGEIDVLEKEQKKSKKDDKKIPEKGLKKKRRLVEKKQKTLLKKLNRMEDELERNLSDPRLNNVAPERTALHAWKPGEMPSSRNQDPCEKTLLLQQPTSKSKQRKIGESIKSKFLSKPAREELEIEREKAIQFYRDIRTRKQQNLSIE